MYNPAMVRSPCQPDLLGWTTSSLVFTISRPLTIQSLPWPFKHVGKLPGNPVWNAVPKACLTLGLQLLNSDGGTGEGIQTTEAVHDAGHWSTARIHGSSSVRAAAAHGAARRERGRGGACVCERKAVPLHSAPTPAACQGRGGEQTGQDAQGEHTQQPAPTSCMMLGACQEQRREQTCTDRAGRNYTYTISSRSAANLLLPPHVAWSGSSFMLEGGLHTLSSSGSRVHCVVRLMM